MPAVGVRTLAALAALAVLPVTSRVASAAPSSAASAAPTAAAAAPQQSATLQAALRAYARGQYQDALPMYLDLFLQDPRPEYLLDIARCRQNLGQHAQAIEGARAYMRRAKKVSPEQKHELDLMIAESERALAAGAPAAAPVASPVQPAPQARPMMQAQPAAPPPTVAPAPAPAPIAVPPPAPAPTSPAQPEVIVATTPGAAIGVSPDEIERARFSGGRLTVELLGSVVGAGLASYGVFRVICGHELCLGGAFAAMGTGLVAPTLITYGVGHAMGGRGTLRTTILAASMGFALGAPFMSLNVGVGLLVGFSAMQILAPIGFEISSNSWAAAPNLALAPAIWPASSPNGTLSGSMFGFRGTL